MEVDNLASRQLLSGFCRKCFFSLNQQDCQGEGTDDFTSFTRSPHPQDNISVDNFPQTRPGEMDWAAPGNCRTQQWLDLRRKAGLCEGLQASARLASPPSCQPRPRKCRGRKPWASSKKAICLALESRILFLDGDFLRGVTENILTPYCVWNPMHHSTSGQPQVPCLHPASCPHPGAPTGSRSVCLASESGSLSFTACFHSSQNESFCLPTTLFPQLSIGGYPE